MGANTWEELCKHSGKTCATAARISLKQPGFTLIAVVTLALGIGANTAVFSLLDVLLFKSLPVKDPQQLVFVQRVFSNNRPQIGLPYSAFEQLRELNHSFTGMAAYESAPVSVSVGGEPEMVWGDFVSGDYFDVLGVTPALGRTLTIEDSQPGEPPLAMLSNSYWKRRFAQDPATIGKTIHAGKLPLTVIGITPPGFLGLRVAGRSADVILPFSFRAQLALKDLDTFAIGRTDDLGQVVARLKPGVGLEQARSELDSIYQQIRAQTMSVDQRGARTEKIGLRAGSRGDSELPQNAVLGLRILVAVVALVLLIVAINVAGLLLTRALARQKEIAVRLAFGVKTTDAVTMISAILVTLLTALLAGYIPARRATRVDPLIALRCE